MHGVPSEELTSNGQPVKIRYPFVTREGAFSVMFMFWTIQIEDGKNDKLVDKLNKNSLVVTIIRKIIKRFIK